jgi:thiol-disulfide isomerase/thioredoxin
MRILSIIFILLLIIPSLGSAGSIDALQKKRPSVVKDFSLPAVNGTQNAEYLGVGTEAFKLSEIDAEVLLIQIFSMYCPHCQAEAPHMNEFHSKLQASPQGKKLKMIGVGAGNTPFEVNYFRKKFDVSFPLFSDEDYTLLDLLAGDVGTPYYMMVQLDSKKDAYKVLFRREGRIAEVDDFLKTVVDKSGLK